MAIKKSGLGDSPSFSAKFLQGRPTLPNVSAIMASNVSKPRRVILSGEVEQGMFLDGTGPTYNQALAMNSETPAGRVVASSHQTPGIMSKYAQVVSPVGGMFRGIHGDSVKQTPEVYSPLWLNSN